MAPQIGGRGGDNADKYKNATNVKDLLDMIGKDVYDKVKEEAQKRSNGELKAGVSFASIFGEETVSTNDPCQLIEDKGDELLGAHGDPCKKDGKGNDVDRFSDKDGAECGNSKIHGNSKGGTGTEVGACAPFRRLHLCNKNIVKMVTNNNDGKAKHDLLAEVCYAAKFEGQSIKTHYPQYQQKYGITGSTMCTMLARSFADIGDIVRGKDLYSGNNKEKNRREKLEENLKTIFGKIYKDLTSGKNVDALKDRYKDDTTNYFQLREDWWALNRETVWKAITCDADGSYFHATCDSVDGKGPSQAHDKCRCPKSSGANADQVPTYFDYVPQYLRWFEEWAEDFCRKKKKYVDIVKTYCREQDKYGNERYCSRNGFDCEKTVNARGKLRYGKQCISCLYACNPYVEWIEKQKEQFDKQKNKYADEIKKYENGAPVSGRQKRGARGISTKVYDGYEKKFYDKLQNNGYGTVNAFLEKLSNEDVCKRVEDDKGGKINFEKVNTGGTAGGGDSGTNVESQGTFYRSKYCQPCPPCGVERKGDNWEPKKDDDKCKRGKLYRPKVGKNGTKIEILKSGEKQKEIENKLNEFCNVKKSEKVSLLEAWECYKGEDVDKNGEEEDDEEDYKNIRTGGGLCILENQKKNEKNDANSQNEPEQFQKTFNDFFNFWVAHMLKDSIHWKKKLDKCINNTNGKTMKCRNGCNNDCECFKKWVAQKKEKEWNPIKQHFYQQKDIGQQQDFIRLTHDDVLDGVLKLEFYKEKSEEKSAEDNQNSLNAEEAEELKHIREIIESEDKNQEAAGGSPAGKKKTLMDKLIEHEEGEAQKCLQKQNECKEQERGRARSAVPSRPAPPGPTGSNDNEDEEDEDDEDEDEVEEVEEEEEEKKEEPPQEEVAPPPPAPTVVDVCSIVAKALAEDNLTQACQQKYAKNNSRLGWKCIPSDTKSVATGSESEPKRQRRDTGSSGAICIPPRRRKLYVTPLTKLAGGDGNTQAGNTQAGNTQAGETPLASTPPTASSQAPNGDSLLLTAFVESAAIETFFLWHRYKKEWESRHATPEVGAGLGNSNSDDKDKDPQKKLQESGNIPTDFLRQMFYTLGDYRDIVVRGVADDKNGGNNIILNASGTQGEKEKMQKIQQKIKDIVQKPNGVPPPAPQNNDEQRKKWWENNAKYIWHGMVCALTYTDSEAKGQTPTQNDTVKKAFFGENNNGNPGSKPKTNGTYEKDYKYETVELKEDTVSGPKINIPGTSDTPTTLTNFISRPPYFRYLEEWGQNFCKERKKKLELIYKECKVDKGARGGKKCSGYGEDCEKIREQDYDTVADLECPKCAKHCALYKRWIEKKQIEFTKQKNVYEEQKKTCKEENGGTEKNNGFCVTPETTCDTAGDFLNRLKKGPCKKDNDSEEDNQEDKIDFKDETKTFRPAENCKPCSLIGIKCKNGVCNGGHTKGNCNGGTITADDIQKLGTSTEDLCMLVSDDSTTEFKGGLENACKGKGIFEGIREDVWTCGKVCGVHICKAEKGSGVINDKEYIQIRALMRLWLEYFFDDYNRIKKKLNSCIQNGNEEEQKCFKGCKEKCDCVDKWIKLKTTEWDNIKKRYFDQYNVIASNDYKLTSFLETLIPEITDANVQNKIIKLSKFDNSCGCSADASAQKNDGHKDAIDCMIKKLEEKANKCKDLPSDTECSQEQTLDLDDQIDEDPENKVAYPKICGDIEEQKEKEEGGCKPAEVPKEVIPEKKVPAAPPKKPEVPAPTERNKQKRKIRSKDYRLTDVLLPSAFPLSVGIAFAALSYFVLKKKTKSTIDLLRVINIPKGDYDIPTLKSSNRYIPYASDRYKGKTYIYMEGDSGDEKYTFMSDTSDITSSESEYEELDINDIYVPGSPKYKTLIEVVLEPSKRDIQSDDTPTNKFTDNEWNVLKNDFITNILQSEQNDIPNNNISANIPLNTHLNTLYFDNPEEKPFITKIHDRNLYSGEEYSYNINMTNNDDIPISDKNDTYSGIDLINDSLNSDQHIDIYDEVLKRKENELFGTNNTKKNTSTNSVAKNTNSDPILNQINLFHKWLDRHRNMCEKLKNKEDILNKLKEEWNKENNNNVDKTCNSDNKPSHNYVLNTDVSIQIDMDNPKTKNEITNMDTNPDKSTMDTILDDLEKYNEPYYYEFYEDDIIYHDVDVEKSSMDDIYVDHNNMDVPTKMHIEMNIVNNKKAIFEEEYPISDIWNI